MTGPRSFLIIPFLLLVVGAFAQSNADALINEADRHFEQLAFARAIEGYKAAADLGAVNDHVTKRLAESHMNLGNTVEAERWYSIVVKFLNREPLDLYHYAQALKSNGKYAEAEEWMDLYLAAVDPESGSRSNISGFARKFVQDVERFKVRPVSINSEYSDFGTAWLGGDKVMFSSARKTTIGIERRAAWNDQPFLDLFVADVLPDGDLANARPLPGSVNTKYHEGPATASTAGDVIWFTRNNYHKGRSQKSQQGVSRLSIFKAYDQMGRWTGVEQFLYNNSEVSTGHPALSPDGKRLYFVSDMPGGNGGTDIYVCHEQGGQWSEPKNLGATINTPFDEVFPFVSSDGTLYFSSTGHPGLGGLDIFAAAPRENGGFHSAVNVGAPVNSSKDDMSFIIDRHNRRGYFSSNRPGSVGEHDNIYTFEMFYPLEDRYLVTGVVIDKEEDVPLIDAEVELYDMEGKLLGTTRTDARGEYGFPVEKDLEYKLIAKMPGRYDAQKHLSTEDIEQQQIVTRDLSMVPNSGVYLIGNAKRKDEIGFIEGMTVSIVNLSNYYAEEVRTGESGDFRFRIQANEDFEVHFGKEGYFNEIIPVSTVGMNNGVININELHDLSFERFEIGKPVQLEGVTWGTGKPKLDAAAKVELDQLVERLMANPALEVEIAVHTDARGDATEKQRQSQSQKQAEAIVEYLRTKGVPKERMNARGYGAEQILNHCAAGEECTDEEHAVNRRSEYRVTAIAE